MLPAIGFKQIVEILIPLRVPILWDKGQLRGIDIEEARHKVLIVEECDSLSPIHQILVDSILSFLGD